MELVSRLGESARECVTGGVEVRKSQLMPLLRKPGQFRRIRDRQVMRLKGSLRDVESITILARLETGGESRLCNAECVPAFHVVKFGVLLGKP